MASETLYVSISGILILTLVLFATIAGFYYNRRFLCYNNPSPYCYSDWTCSGGTTPMTDAVNAAAECTYVESTVDGCEGVMCPNSANCPMAWCFISNYQYDTCTTGASGSTSCCNYSIVGATTPGGCGQ